MIVLEVVLMLQWNSVKVEVEIQEKETKLVMEREEEMAIKVTNVIGKKALAVEERHAVQG
jgi:hypothetical protein